MKKAELKKKMLEESINKHQAVINDFNKRIFELKQENEGLDTETYSLARRSFNDQVLNEIDMLNEQLEFANDEMELLYKMQNQNTHLNGHDEARLGAAVVTDKGTFFVAASIEQFSVNGQEFMGLSTQSPLFQAMNGRKKGESFAYNGKTYHVEDVF